MGCGWLADGEIRDECKNAIITNSAGREGAAAGWSGENVLLDDKGRDNAGPSARKYGRHRTEGFASRHR